MSTFTEFNGPQQGISGPTLSQLTAMIEAYNKLSVQLQTHVEKAVSDISDVHNVKAYVDNAKAAITSAYINYIDTQVNTINDHFTLIENMLEDKADESLVETQLHAIQDSIDALQRTVDTFVDTDDFNNAINNINATLATVQESLDDFVAHWSIDQDDATFDGTLKADEVIAKVKALNTVDYVKWSEFQAPFAGTGGQEMGTQGAYVLGCLSEDWSEDAHEPVANKYKPIRVYVKYLNSNPFDAIIDIAVMQKDESFAGTMVAKVAKQAGTWEDLAFHIVEGTGSQGQEEINKLYLCVSSKGLAVQRADDNTVTVTSTTFRVAGENFCAVGQEGYVRPNGMLHGVSTVRIGTDFDGLTSVDKLRAEKLYSERMFDLEQNEFMHVDRIDLDEGGGVITTHRYMFMGNENYDSITFSTRPNVVLEDDQGQMIESPLVTAKEAYSMGIPIGGMIRWAAMDNIPEGYLACDGSKVNETDYPELAEVLTPDIRHKITLPFEEYSIIRALPSEIMKTTTASPEDVMTYEALNQKIVEEVSRAQTAEQGIADDLAAEVDRATTAEQGLSDTIDQVSATADQNTEDIAAEITRAQAAEQDIADDLSAEVTRATTAEQANATAITAETTRAEAAEQELESDLAVTDAKADQNADDIAAEAERAQAAERTINTRISTYHPGA